MLLSIRKRHTISLARPVSPVSKTSVNYGMRANTAHWNKYLHAMAHRSHIFPPSQAGTRILFRDPDARLAGSLDPPPRSRSPSLSWHEGPPPRSRCPLRWLAGSTSVTPKPILSAGTRTHLRGPDAHFVGSPGPPPRPRSPLPLLARRIHLRDPDARSLMARRAHLRGPAARLDTVMRLLFWCGCIKPSEQ